MASSGRLLIVEGDRATREMLVSLFEKDGLLIEDASSADAAAARLAVQDFDIVLSDLGGSGLELVEKLRRLRPGTVVVLVAPVATIDATAVTRALEHLARSNLELRAPEDVPLPDAIPTPEAPGGEDFLAAAAAQGMTLHELDERYTEQVLRAMGGNKVQAARILGIDRKTLYRRAEREARAAASDEGEVRWKARSASS